MSEEPEAQPQAEGEGDTKPVTKRFRKRFDTVRLTPDAAERQGKAATLAWKVLGNRDDAVAFLNTHDDTLGGRPIDLAVASAAGLTAVIQLLESRKAA